VVTFSRPISWAKLAELRSRGLAVETIELVSQPDRSGLRWTIGGAFGPGVEDLVAEAATDAGVELLGIVSAEVIVPDAATLRNVQNDAAVFLVDLSVEDFMRNNPGIQDVSQNDVYWSLAGWD